MGKKPLSSSVQATLFDEAAAGPSDQLPKAEKMKKPHNTTPEPPAKLEPTSPKSKKQPPVNKMRARVRRLPPVHYQTYYQATLLLNYTYTLIEKFPKHEKLGLMQAIRGRTEDVVELILEAASFYSRDRNREQLLRTADIRIKMIAVLVEYAYNKRYITDKNLTAWASKLSDLDDAVVAWAMGSGKEKEKEKEKAP
jgi:hypothetical protein